MNSVALRLLLVSVFVYQCNSAVLTGSKFKGDSSSKYENDLLLCTEGEPCSVTCSNTAKSCKGATIQCPDGFDCSITCDSGGRLWRSNDVCYGMIVNGGVGGRISISCNDDAACTNAVINARNAAELNLRCSAEGFLTCTGLTIYFPQSTNGVAATTISAGDDSFSGYGREMQFFSVNGWRDISIIDYLGSFQYQRGTMHCGDGFDTTCAFSANAWTCADAKDVCNDPPSPIPTPKPTIAVLPTRPAPIPSTPIPTRLAPIPTAIPSAPPSTSSTLPPCRGNQIRTSISGQCQCPNTCAANTSQNPITCECERPETPAPIVIFEEVVCTENCECSGTRPCTLDCSAKDSCKEATLTCPRNHECNVICAENACKAAVIVGPQNADFKLFCLGTASCIDAKIQSEQARDVLYECAGKDSCKGAQTDINCGMGICELLFIGESSGNSATINTNNALGFSCVGRFAPCPDNYLAPCPNSECAANQIQNPSSCRCECSNNANGVCPGNYYVFDEQQCECVCPLNAPSPQLCASMGMVWRDCSCFESNFCCFTSVENYKPWRGLCWDETTAEGCNAEPNGRCIWHPDPTKCLAAPPVNDINPNRACSFTTDACSQNADCCSELCRVDNTCR